MPANPSSSKISLDQIKISLDQIMAKLNEISAKLDKLEARIPDPQKLANLMSQQQRRSM